MISSNLQTSVVRPKRTRIKICGMTDVAEVAHAIAHGVDAIGMILYADSPRTISLSQAAKIRQYVPAFVSLVGVFVNADKAFIEQATDQVGLDIVQLHGDEDDSFGQSLSRPFIKAIRAKTAEQVLHDCQQFPSARAILLDPYVKGQHGGTGQSLNLDLWPNSLQSDDISNDDVSETKSLSKPITLILAGGLSPTNVASRIQALEPYAVDLNSGLEAEAGRKDPRLVERAIKVILQQDANLSGVQR